MPPLERVVGLERAGAWSLWSEVLCLVPSLISFFIGTGKYGEQGPAWNRVLLFGGIALSRVGLWSFDLCQVKILQLATEDHPRRNRIMALQIALQNLFDLAKYAVTLIAATPAQFKWTALVSWIAVVTGGLAYTAFLRSVRGHLVHFDLLCKPKVL
jgi:iron-regulated transporter 1